jgi:hypothetical protein
VGTLHSSYGMIQAIIAQRMDDSCLKAVETGLRLCVLGGAPQASSAPKSKDPLTVCPVEAVGTVLYCSQLGRSLFGIFVGVTPTETVGVVLEVQ